MRRAAVRHKKRRVHPVVTLLSPASLAMFAAFLATFFFAVSIICAGRNTRANGPRDANLGRLTVAVAALALFAHTLGSGFSSASTPWMLASGAVALGIGDIGIFAALPLIGVRLSVLMNQCLAAPVAAVVEWLWLDTRLTGPQIFWGTVILAGVALALMPSKSSPPRVKLKPIGFLFGLIGGVGQGIGAIITRKGNFVALEAGEPAVNGLTAAYHRNLGGLAFVAVFFLGLALLRKPAAPALAPEPRGWRWMIANGLAGPVLAISCYQWALAHTPSGIVLPIVATTPLLAMPLAYWAEGDRPSKRAIAGSLVAVGGCVALVLAR